MRKLGGWGRLWVAVSLVWLVMVSIFFAIAVRDIKSTSTRETYYISKGCQGYVDGTKFDISLAPSARVAKTSEFAGAMLHMVNGSAGSSESAKMSVNPFDQFDTAPASTRSSENATSSNSPGQVGTDTVNMVAMNEATNLVRSCADAKARDYAAETSAEWYRDILVFAALAIVPPFLLLCLGGLIGWVVRGFRPHTK